MRSRLISAEPADVSWYLGQVLMDLLSTHTDDTGNSQDSEAVVRFLDVHGGTDLTFASEYWGGEVSHRTAKDEQHLRVAKRDVFDRFTKEQVLAVCGWLHEARRWRDLSLDLDSVESALRYWESRRD